MHVEMHGMQWSFPFITPVDTKAYPDYLNVVATPMDLGAMRTKMDSNSYRDPKVSLRMCITLSLGPNLTIRTELSQDFWHDLNLVFDNAKKYNPQGSDCFLMAQTLQVEPLMGAEQWKYHLI
jgi:hypothetical protein